MLADIIAKTLVLVDSFLSIFATTEMVTPTGNDTCNIPYMLVNTTVCGDELIDTLGTLLLGLVRMGADALVGLSATVTSG